MNSANTRHRFRLSIIIALMATLALGSFWLLEVLRRSSEVMNAIQVRNEPDYSVDQFHFIRMSDAGHARYTVSGTKLTHYPASDTFEIQQPVLHSLSDNQAPITMRSERATIDNVGNTIHMHKNVHVDRPKKGTSEKFSLQSNHLLVLPDKNVMETEESVDIHFGELHLRGEGMVANNATREFRLLKNVRGTFAQAPQ
jgi:lipopolysaccharide export system protein LptC